VYTGCHGKSIHHGHPYVDDRHPVVAAPDGVECQPAVANFVNTVAVGSQRVGDHGAQPDMVVCDQHTEG
jgi:hypothetical protein